MCIFLFIEQKCFIILENIHLTFRGNSLATKAVEAHLKIVAEKVNYLVEIIARQRPSYL